MDFGEELDSTPNRANIPALRNMHRTLQNDWNKALLNRYAYPWTHLLVQTCLGLVVLMSQPLWVLGTQILITKYLHCYPFSNSVSLSHRTAKWLAYSHRVSLASAFWLLATSPHLFAALVSICPVQPGWWEELCLNLESLPSPPCMLQKKYLSLLSG